MGNLACGLWNIQVRLEFSQNVQSYLGHLKRVESLIARLVVVSEVSNLFVLDAVDETSEFKCLWSRGIVESSLCGMQYLNSCAAVCVSNRDFKRHNDGGGRQSQRGKLVRFSWKALVAVLQEADCQNLITLAQVEDTVVGELDVIFWEEADDGYRASGIGEIKGGAINTREQCIVLHVAADKHVAINMVIDSIVNNFARPA